MTSNVAQRQKAARAANRPSGCIEQLLYRWAGVGRRRQRPAQASSAPSESSSSFGIQGQLDQLRSKADACLKRAIALKKQGKPAHAIHELRRKRGFEATSAKLEGMFYQAQMRDDAVELFKVTQNVASSFSSGMKSAAKSGVSADACDDLNDHMTELFDDSRQLMQSVMDNGALLDPSGSTLSSDFGAYDDDDLQAEFAQLAGECEEAPALASRPVLPEVPDAEKMPVAKRVIVSKSEKNPYVQLAA